MQQHRQPNHQGHHDPYKKVIECIDLCQVWLTAICKELGNIVQGYNNRDKINVNGTNTVKFLTINEIKQMPKDRRDTYAHIVIDYRTQKNDPNPICIMVSGNLIGYPNKLTTRTADIITTKLM